MNNTLKIKLIINLVLLCTFCISMSAQFAIKIPDGGDPPGPMPTPVYIDVNEDCEYEACFNTYMFDSDGVISFEEGNEYYVPPMYLRIKINDIDEVYPLTDWELTNDVYYLSSWSTIVEGMYKSTVCVNLGFIEKCLTEIQSNDNPVEPDLDKKISIPYQLQLLEIPDVAFGDGLGGPVYGPYPICDYTSSSSMFSCEIFETTQPYCDPEGCEDSELYFFDGVLNFACEECIEANNFQGKKKSRYKEETGSTRSFKTSLTVISPNPFSEHINVFDMKGAESKSIRVMNNIGQIVKTVHTNDSQLSIPTHNFESGIYYVIIQNGTRIETFKILK